MSVSPLERTCACGNPGWTTDARTDTALCRSCVQLQVFEHLVLNQKPADKPWEPVTPFDYESRKLVEGRQPELIWQHLMQCPDADILDYGCGPSAHLVRLLNEFRPSDAELARIVGYDPQLPGTERYLQLTGTYDLVICREVMEHCTVREIRRIVSQLCALSAGLVYATTRFHPKPTHLLDVATSDDLDPTHISLTNQTWLRHLFVLEGFKRRADLETKLDWQKKGRCLVYERV